MGIGDSGRCYSYGITHGGIFLTKPDAHPTHAGRCGLPEHLT